jgi:quercetin dioxygenase-like cupin family protein
MKSAMYGVMFDILVGGCATPKLDTEVQAVQLVRSSASWDGEPLPAYPTGRPEITILRITIPPRTSLPMHKHPIINAGVLLKGELTVVTEGGEVLNLKPYDPIVETVHTWHYGKNEGDEPAEIIVFYAGEEGEPITVIKPDH